MHGTGIAGRVTKNDILALHRRRRREPTDSGSRAAGDAAGRATGPSPSGQTPATGAGLAGQDRADVGHAPEDRRAHGR